MKHPQLLHEDAVGDPFFHVGLAAWEHSCKPAAAQHLQAQIGCRSSGEALSTKVDSDTIFVQSKVFVWF